MAARKIGLWKRLAFYLFNFYPPFVGAGIRIRRIDPDFRFVDVEMGLHFWNRNLVGTQFGGSLYAMCDPFYMTLLLQRLGGDFIVWDKSAEIRFLKPGRGRVRARFEVSDERFAEIRQALETQPKIEPVFAATIIDESGQAIAEVAKTVYIRHKRRD